MITKDEFDSLYAEALERVMERGMDGNDLTDVFDEIVNEKRKLKETKELIEKFHQERSNENDQ